MISYIVRRIAMFVPMLLAITLLNFLIMNIAPGDPLSSLMSPELAISPEQIEVLRVQMGLDRPWPVRYLIWLGQTAQGNLGFRQTPQDHGPVLDALKATIPKTLELMVAAIFIANVVGVSLGVISAVWRYSFTEYVLTVAAFLGVSTPGFFMALALMFFVGFKFDLLPISGYRTPLLPPSTLDHLRYLVLPASALALQYVATMLRFTRTSMLEVMKQDYVTTARAKGLREAVVIFRHILRNAACPLVTTIGLQLPNLVGGSIVIETIFAWPGMGFLAMDALNARDYNLLMGITLVGAVMVLCANLITDIVYTLVDPRARSSFVQG